MVATQHPLERGPVDTGRKEPLDRPITPPWAGPSRETPHRHTAGHHQHGFGHPAQAAERGTIQTLASTSSIDHNIRHGRLLLVSVGLGNPYSTRCATALPHFRIALSRPASSPHCGEGIDRITSLFRVVLFSILTISRPICSELLLGRVSRSCRYIFTPSSIDSHGTPVTNSGSISLRKIVQ